MANKIILKKTSTASKVPLATDLEVGEIAVNLADQKLYSKNASGTVILVGDGQGTGDVTGPSSATDNAVARFDSTTGKLIQNSVVTVDDTGNVAGLLSEQYNTAGTPPTIVEGLEAWDSGNGTLELGLTGGLVSYKYGQQEFVRVYNGSGSAMTKGQVVYIVGAQGNRVDVRLALATSDATSAGTIGFVAESIANGAEGWVQVSGTLYKLNTSALTAGAPLYLSPSVAGAYTTTKPTAPNHTVILGWVERVSATVGSFYVKVDNGYELDELHNVLITSPANAQALVYNSTVGVWENNTVSLTAGVNGVLPVANGGTGTATPNLVAGTNITVSGTWPNQTINSTASGLPSQTGNAGKYLTTDGTVASWETVSSGTQSYTRTTFTATAGQTSFTVSYNPACFQVYINGVLLTSSDYTATSGTAFVLTTPAALNDVVEAFAFSVISVGQVAASGVLGGSSGQVLTSNGTNGEWQPAPISLPSQTGNSGKYLTTDGTNASWATVATGGGPITQNTDQITTNQTIASGSNGFSVGPMTIASGYTVTVASGQRWVII